MFNWFKKKPKYLVLNTEKPGRTCGYDDDELVKIKSNLDLWFGNAYLKRLMFNRALAIVGNLHTEIVDHGVTMRVFGDRQEKNLRQKDDKTWEKEIVTTRRVFINE